ncbi:MAG: YdcF family protein [Ruminococcus sp.]|nr:YdcF family protein [Ruminococcus sp.]
MTKTKKLLKKLLRIMLILAALAAIGITAVFSVNAYVKKSAEPFILEESAALQLEDTDCIIVLGCRVNGETPSPMLGDRLKVGCSLYENAAAPKLLMSGDHGRAEYDEVNAMKKFAMDRGAPDEDVFMDHAGFSTYESMYRAKEIFGAKKVIIVTQKYHLYRAVYIARKLGLEAYGVPSDLQGYTRQKYYTLREVLARNKDFVTTIVKPKPTYLGEQIPISGDGRLTNDK